MLPKREARLLTIIGLTTMHATSRITFMFYPIFIHRRMTVCFLLIATCGGHVIYSRLSLSRIPRDSLKCFEISVLRHIRFAILGEKLIRLTPFNKYMCNWTLEVRDLLKILWKRGEIAPKEQFLLFSTIFFYLLLDFHV